MEYDGIQYHGYKVKQAHAMFRSQVYFCSYLLYRGSKKKIGQEDSLEKL